MELISEIRYKARSEIERRKRMFERKEEAEESLLEFIRMFWHCVEPENPFVEGWAIEGICEHLEAVTNGDIKRLIMNVPPGFSKSLTSDVFWPAWEWGPRNMPTTRYICTSSQAYLTERDNGRFLRVVSDPVYQKLWGDRFSLELTGVSNITNSKTGFKLATTVGGISTGARGNRVIIDDPNSTDPKKNESDVQREGINGWVTEVMPDRLNSIEKDAIVLIQQRTHENDVTATLLERGQDYVHFCVPMEYDPARHCETSIGWSDPRTIDGELCWPERFSPEVIRKMKIEKGPIAYVGQYQQSPTTRGGNIIMQDYWRVYDEDCAKRLHLMAAGSTKLVYPPFDLVILSVDTAISEKKENCYSACSVWGIWKDWHDLTKLLLIYAWQKRLKLHGENPIDGESDEERKAKQGLVELIAATAKQWKAQAILIENKSNGPDVINELARLYRKEPWQLIPIDPKGDKVARVHATVPVFAQGTVFAPDKEWAQKVINQFASFPRGKDKDLVDSGTQAILYLRNAGIIMRPDEELDDRAIKNAPQGEIEENIYGA